MKSGLTIKLNSARLLLLRAAMKKEELRLQNTASQVARIASGLEMDVAAKANIDASLTKLRTQLKKDAENMATMQSMADLAMSELSKKDDDLANKAKGINYTFRQMGSTLSGMAGTGLSGWSLSSILDQAGNLSTKPALNLNSQFIVDSTQKLGNLFDVAGDRVTDALQGLSLKDFLFPGGESVAVKSGVGTTTQVLSAIKTTAGATAAIVAALGLGTAVTSDTGKKSSSSSNKKSSQSKSVWDQLGDAGKWVSKKASDTGKWVGKKASDVGEWAADKAEDAMDAVKDAGKWVGEKASDAGAQIADTAKDVWDGVKSVANSKPVEYLWEMGGDTLSGVADIGGFCANVATGQVVSAAADGYSFVNDFFSLTQDSQALLLYGMGAGLEALGMQSDAADYYSRAEESAAWEGLSGAWHAGGFDTLGYIVDGADLAVGSYKMATGIEKLNQSLNSMSLESLADLKNNLFSLSGWKSVGSLDDAADLAEQIGHYNSIVSNVKLGYTYVDGTFSTDGWLSNALATAALNTALGKTGAGVVGTLQGWLDYFDEVLDYSESKQKP